MLKEFFGKLKEFLEKLKVSPTWVVDSCRKTSKKALIGFSILFNTLSQCLVDLLEIKSCQRYSLTPYKQRLLSALMGQLSLLPTASAKFCPRQLECGLGISSLLQLWSTAEHAKPRVLCLLIAVKYQIWSLTQFNSVDFSQSWICVKKCAFNKRTIKVFVSCS